MDGDYLSLQRTEDGDEFTALGPDASGQLVPIGSEAFRAACEARAVLAMPGLDRRQGFLAVVERRRGKPAADRLKADIMKAWELRQKMKGEAA